MITLTQVQRIKTLLDDNKCARLGNTLFNVNEDNMHINHNNIDITKTFVLDFPVEGVTTDSFYNALQDITTICKVDLAEPSEKVEQVSILARPIVFAKIPIGRFKVKDYS